MRQAGRILTGGASIVYWLWKGLEGATGAQLTAD